MIVLRRVSKDVGKGQMRKRVLDAIDWVIQPRTQIVILGQPGSGKSLLLQILSGLRTPTTGLVTRRGSICSPAGLGALGAGLTARQFAMRAARFYHCNPAEVIQFIAGFTQLGELLDVPMRWLPVSARQSIQYAARYAIPFDCYVFDGSIGGKAPNIQKACRAAYDLRSRDAAMIVATRQVSVARTFGGTGGIIHRGRLALFATVEEAIAAYETLPKIAPRQKIQRSIEVRDEDDDDETLDTFA